MEIPSIKDQQSQIEYEQDDLQCLESCMEQGFSINDWIMCKSNNIELMKGRLIMETDKQLTESYDINTSDNQMHAIDVIMQVLERHVGTRKQNPNSEDNILRGDKDMARCVKYVLSRLENS